LRKTFKTGSSGKIYPGGRNLEKMFLRQELGEDVFGGRIFGEDVFKAGALEKTFLRPEIWRRCIRRPELWRRGFRRPELWRRCIRLPELWKRRFRQPKRPAGPAGGKVRSRKRLAPGSFWAAPWQNLKPTVLSWFPGP
jgi:hypothetical protein